MRKEIIKGLYVSQDGKFYRQNGIELIPRIDSARRYLIVNFEKTIYLAHRLVAEAFCAKPMDETQPLVVDHLDGDTRNNHMDNLQWVTQSENLRRAYASGRLKPINAKQTRLFYQGEEVGVFPTRKAAIDFAVERYSISRTSLSKYSRSGDCRLLSEEPVAKATKKLIDNSHSNHNVNGVKCDLYCNGEFIDTFLSAMSAAIYANEHYGASVSGLRRNKKSKNCVIVNH